MSPMILTTAGILFGLVSAFAPAEFPTALAGRRAQTFTFA